jgi:hypothetical protein
MECFSNTLCLENRASSLPLMNQAYGKLSGTGIMLRTEGHRAPTCS